MPEVENPESSLERVRRRLYAAPKVDGIAPHAPEHEAETVEGWAPELTKKPKLSAAAVFLIAAVSFFVVAGLVALLILVLGGRSVSSDRISISVEGPSSVGGGDTVPLFVVIKNDNPLTATKVTLSIDFPEGAYAADNPSEPLAHYTQDIEDIGAGQSARQSVRAIFFGAEQQKVVVPIRVEYRTENSNAVFVKEDTYEFVITTAPVSVSVTTLSEVASGQSLTLVAKVRSNAPDDLANVAVKVAYPFGFIATDATPTPVAGSLFSLGTMRPGEEHELRITGTLSGQDGDERVFTFSAGVLANPDARELTQPVYTIAQTPVVITKSFLGLSLSLRGEDTETLVVSEGEKIEALLTWINTLSSSIADGKITVTFSGDALDASSIAASNGFYRSSDRTITFSRDTNAGLQNLLPGDTGSGSFRFAVKDGKALEELRSPAITLTISVAGRRIGEGRVAENLSSTLVRTVKVATDLALSTDIVRTVGPFKNTGPWPPEVDRETTYTIRWSVGNSVNSVANANVTATLPSFVRFTGQVSPVGAIAYNETTSQVTWDIGDMAAGTSRDGAFQIAFTPSSSQQGSTPSLVTNQLVSGFDRFTQKEVSSQADFLTTEASKDPGFQSSYGRVK